MNREHQKEKSDYIEMNLRKFEEMKKDFEKFDIEEKLKARSQAQRDIKITQETHEKMVQDLRLDRQTQKEEIERIRKQEDKISRLYEFISHF